MKKEGREQGVSKPGHRLQEMSCLRGEYQVKAVFSLLRA